MPILSLPNVQGDVSAEGRLVITPDVLLRHRLLPQPGVLESFRLVDVETHRRGATIADGPGHCRITSHVQSASSTPAVGMDEYDDLVRGLQDLLGLPAKLFPNLPHLAVEPSNALMPVIRLGVDEPGGHIELEVAIAKCDQTVDVRFIETFMGTL